MLYPNLHTVLFTGGLDSTYRLCQLALDKDAVVQPVYIMFPKDGHVHYRPEIANEVKAQDEILDYLTHHPLTKAKFLPIQRIHRSEIPSDIRYRSLEKWLCNCRLGWQYIYIALYAKWHPGVELCHEVYSPLFAEYDVKFFKTPLNETYMFTEGLPKILRLTFENVTFPLLGVSRKDMLDNLRRWKFDDVLSYVWFCYCSVDDKPCGACDNCYTKIEQGLSFLFDKNAMKRYYIRKVLGFFSSNRLHILYLDYLSTGLSLHDPSLYFVLFPLDKNYDYTHLKDLRFLQKISDFTLSQLKHLCHKALLVKDPSQIVLTMYNAC